MNVENPQSHSSASVKYNIEIALRIEVDHAERSAAEQAHAVRIEIQQKVELAWCAGFFDGEGCVTLARVRRTCGHGVNYRTRVYIGQNCLETLHVFRDRIGENSVLVQLPNRENYTRPCYQLAYDGIHGYRLLKKLRPYLVRKGAEADVIFEFYRDGEPTRHFGPKGVPSEIWHLRERCFDALRCLK